MMPVAALVSRNSYTDGRGGGGGSSFLCPEFLPI